MKGERRKKPLALRAHPWTAGVCFPQPRVCFTEGWPEPPCTVGESSSQAPAASELPVPAAVRRGWRGREDGRAGGQSAELGSRRGDPRRPQPPTVCKRPPLWVTGELPAASNTSPGLEREDPGSLHLYPGRHGSAPRLGGRAGGSSQVKLLLSPCEAWSSWKMPRRDGRSSRRLQPLAAAPLPFRFH